MANSEIFKTVFKGYNKEEVVAYIENLNRQTAFLQRELDAANARMVQLESEQSEDAAEKSKMEVDEKQLRESVANELIPVLSEQIRTQMIAELRPAIEQEMRKKIEGEMASKYEEAARSEINSRIQTQAGELRELRRRAQLYDDNREVLADLMIKAKNDAADIIRDAEAHAKELREDAESRFRLLISDYELLKANLLSSKGEAAAKLSAALECLDAFEKRFSCMDHDVKNSKAHISD